MRVIFMGTPEIAVPVLGELVASGHEIAAVYTRAPAPRGRGQQLRNSPVHMAAQEFGLEVRTPKNFKAVEAVEEFSALKADVAIVIAYGLILPEAILRAPTYGCLNLHASLLPRWRGAAPIHRAIMAGDTETGVQVMQMEAGLDTGPILLSETIAIGPDTTTGTLHDQIAIVAAQLTPRALAALERGALMASAQASDGVIYADKISSAEAKIDWAAPGTNIDCHIRGLSPFPGAWFEHNDARVKVLMSKLDQGRSGEPGRVLCADDKLIVACGEGAVELVTLQRSGKRAQDAVSFLRGIALKEGDSLLSCSDTN